MVCTRIPAVLKARNHNRSIRIFDFAFYHKSSDEQGGGFKKWFYTQFLMSLRSLSILFGVKLIMEIGGIGSVYFERHK